MVKSIRVKLLRIATDRVRCVRVKRDNRCESTGLRRAGGYSSQTCSAVCWVINPWESVATVPHSTLVPSA
ncbi:hypothetical protein GCM10023145_36970 [Angustibacter luteus]